MMNDLIYSKVLANENGEREREDEREVQRDQESAKEELGFLFSSSYPMTKCERSTIIVALVVVLSRSVENAKW